MSDNGNTESDDRAIEVEHEDISRFGMIAFDTFNSDEFRGLSPKAVRTYIGLTMFASKARVSYPRQRTIATMAGLQRHTVNYAIRELVEAGLVKKAIVIRKDRSDLISYTLIKPPSIRKSE